MRKYVLPIFIFAIAAFAGVYTGSVLTREKPSLPRGKTIFISFLDADHGGGCVIRTPEAECVLIDPGPSDKAQQLTNYLREKGIDQLKIILTNLDYHRAGSLCNVLDGFPVTDIISTQKPEQILSRLRSRQNAPKISTAIAGDVIHVSPTTKIQVLAPPQGLPITRNLDDSSMVLQIAFGKTKALLCSDIRLAGEANVVRSGADIRSDLVLLPRSPRYDGISLEFLSLVRPAYSIMQTGGGFGYPGASVLRRLETKNCGTYLYRTDKDGTIEIVSDGHNILISKNGGGQ